MVAEIFTLEISVINSSVTAWEMWARTVYGSNFKLKLYPLTIAFLLQVIQSVEANENYRWLVILSKTIACSFHLYTNLTGF